MQKYYILKNDTKQTLGPVETASVKQWIKERMINHDDSICKEGEENWLKIIDSDFKDEIIEKMNIDRISATTCPKCGSAMVAIVKNSPLGIWLTVIGVILIPACIGIPIWAWGMFELSKGKLTFFNCPNCKYSRLN